MQKERAAIKRIGRKGSRVEILNNSPIISRVPWSGAVKKLLRENFKLGISA